MRSATGGAWQRPHRRRGLSLGPRHRWRPTHGSKWDHVPLDVASEQLADLIRRNRPNRLFYRLVVFARFGSPAADAEYAAIRQQGEAGLPMDVRDACLED